MNIKLDLLESITSVNMLATATKLQRFLKIPAKYCKAIAHRELLYKVKGITKTVTCNTFFGSQMTLALPASTDIYLTGGKSHDSEIKLAKFLIRNLGTGDCFLDVGAHYGYFSLLGTTLVGSLGRVIAVEAAPKTYKILKSNKQNHNQLEVVNLAISNNAETISFYEFPNLYSEYNTLDIAQFENEDWYESAKPKELKVKSKTLDFFLKEYDFKPNIIKIDVEGAEFNVVSGGMNFLTNNSPLIVMEYLNADRGNSNHIKAEKLLNSLNYSSHLIDENGDIFMICNVDAYLSDKGIESENIVFVKDIN